MDNNKYKIVVVQQDGSVVWYSPEAAASIIARESVLNEGEVVNYISGTRCALGVLMDVQPRIDDCGHYPCPSVYLNVTFLRNDGRVHSSGMVIYDENDKYITGETPFARCTRMVNFFTTGLFDRLEEVSDVDTIEPNPSCHICSFPRNSCDHNFVASDYGFTEIPLELALGIKEGSLL